MVGSYGFIDPNLTLSSNSLILSIIKFLMHFVYQQRIVTSGIYLGMLLFLFFLFKKTLSLSQNIPFGLFMKVLFPLVLILVVSYPMLSYDLFNYMTTAKVAYTYKENPYVVMPIEIPNDTNLAFTRAANKPALYGPVWILLTWVPHTLGMGSLWQTIIAFKLINALWYFGFCYILWRGTNNMKNVIFFALNPLILIETLVSGHNDIVMMMLVCLSILLWRKKELYYRFLGLVFVSLSILIKGATIVLVPLFFFRNINRERLLFASSILLFLVFVVVAPLREELYPWYAVWFLAMAAFLPYPKYSLLWQFLIALSVGLELRHIPYMAMGYYEGPGPLLRIVFTIIPVAVWGIWFLVKMTNDPTLSGRTGLRGAGKLQIQRK